MIIICAECADGHGGEGFYRALRDCASPAELYARQVATPQDKTAPDQWESQILARILIRHRVIFVSRPEMKPIIEEMKMLYSPSLAEAVRLAKSWGKDSPVYASKVLGISRDHNVFMEMLSAKHMLG